MVFLADIVSRPRFSVCLATYKHRAQLSIQIKCLTCSHSPPVLLRSVSNSRVILERGIKTLPTKSVIVQVSAVPCLSSLNCSHVLLSCQQLLLRFSETQAQMIHCFHWTLSRCWKKQFSGFLCISSTLVGTVSSTIVCQNSHLSRKSCDNPQVA